jgi:hypothetical protein
LSPARSPVVRRRGSGSPATAGTCSTFRSGTRRRPRPLGESASG